MQAHSKKCPSKENSISCWKTASVENNQQEPCAALSQGQLFLLKPNPLLEKHNLQLFNVRGWKKWKSCSSGHGRECVKCECRIIDRASVCLIKETDTIARGSWCAMGILPSSLGSENNICIPASYGINSNILFKMEITFEACYKVFKCV